MELSTNKYKSSKLNITRTLRNGKFTFILAILYSILIITLAVFKILPTENPTIPLTILSIHNLLVYVKALQYWQEYKKLFYELVMESL